MLISRKTKFKEYHILFDNFILIISFELQF